MTLDRDAQAVALAAAMRADGQPDVAIDAFLRAWRRICAGETGLLPETAIEPARDLPDAEGLGEDDALILAGEAALSGVAVVKLNGGLGTSMGMRGPKSLVEVRDGLCFLDLLARQVLALRRDHHADVPLLLMNSFATREASLEHLRAYPELEVPGLPLDFVQHRVPKIRADDFGLVDPADPRAWCPPGHGDLFPALLTSGVLDALRARGVHTLFVSNVDNLGATLDPALLGHFRASGAPMMMEVADRTVADRKGGHLCQRREDGALVLRELAQCPDADRGAFTDIRRHRYFNTNSLWFDTEALAAALHDHGGSLPIAPIVNRKTLDPNDPGSRPIIQLESAMGSAISELVGATAVRVPRRRFAPVKTTADLLSLRSDRFMVDPRSGAIARLGRNTIDIVLDGPYRTVDELAAHFPAGVPSLIDADRLEIRGDVVFGADIEVHGDCTIEVMGDGTAHLTDGSRISGLLQLFDQAAD
ncbi:MAG: hypothetical protein RIT45_1833 [Pseudomonadota bacterium]|jgi:UTP--glucose-1-phosphate uridylyltransferase